MLSDLITLPAARNKLLFWVFDNAQHHISIRNAIQAQKSIILPLYVLDPLNLARVMQWLQDHQSAHNDMNDVLGLTGSDLTTVDFKDPLQRRAWADIHYQEHYTAAAALKIP